MPRYEFSEGTSNKFWQIELSGKSFTTTYGKIGTAGQKTMKQFKSDAEAKKEYDKLIAEKVKKGYEPADGDEDEEEMEEMEEEDEKPAKKTKAVAKPAPKTASKPKAAAQASGGDKSTPRYFEFVEGSSSKFWQIWMDGTCVLTKYGRIGAAGSTTQKEMGSDEKANKEYDKLVNEKTKKGYEEKGRPGGDDDEDIEDIEDEEEEEEEEEEEKPTPKAAKPKAAAKPSGGDKSTPRYFEFSEGTSNKFWQIWMDGTCVLTKYGRIGSAGSTTQKEMGSEEKANKEYDKLVNEKTKKGYEETDLPDGDDED